MKIEIVCSRDSDSNGCDHRVFVNGIELEDGTNGRTPELGFVQLSIENIDPGAGYSWEDWAESTKTVQEDMSLTGAFRKAVVSWRDAASENSPYIDDPKGE